MSKILQIARTDLLVFLSNRGNLVGLLVIPIVMTVILGIFIPGGQGPDRVRVDVIDRDQGQIAQQFLSSVRQANGTLLLCPMDNDAEDFCNLADQPNLTTEAATQRVQDGDAAALIEIPPGFSQAVQTLQPASIHYIAVEDLATPSYVRQAVEAALTQVNGSVVAARTSAQLADAVGIEGDLSAAVYQQASELWDEQPISVDFRQTAQAAVDPTSTMDIGGFNQSVPGMGSMMCLFTVLGSMAILIDEKKQGTIQRLATLPISRAQLLSGKILGRFALGIVQYLIVFAVGIIAGINFGGDLLALVLIMVAFTLASTALAFALGSRLTNEQQASGLAMLLGMTLAPLGGAWWPLEVVPKVMQTVGHISPIAWAMDGYTALMFRSGGLSDVTLSIAVLFGMALVFLVYGIRRFSYQL